MEAVDRNVEILQWNFRRLGVLLAYEAFQAPEDSLIGNDVESVGSEPLYNAHVRKVPYKATEPRKKSLMGQFSIPHSHLGRHVSGAYEGYQGTVGVLMATERA